MAQNTIHVVPSGDGWAVKKEGNERHSSTHETQKAAIDSAREMAREGDDIVIHRTDGTVRETVTYTGARAGGNSNGDRSDRDDNRPRFHDIWSVGSRVSWGAILAGVLVAMGTAALLTAFAAGVQIPLLENVNPKTWAITTAIAAMVVLLAALFLGGFVASRMTTRETPTESVFYGVLVWAGFAVVAALGIGAGASFGLDVFNSARAERDRAAAGDSSLFARLNITTEDQFRVFRERFTPEQQQKWDEAWVETKKLGDRSSAAALAWWTFLGLLLPLLASIGGAMAGCGYDPTRRVRPEETPPGVENRITQYERTNA